MSYINNPTIKNSAPFLGNDTAIKSLTLINAEGGQVLQTKDVSGRIRYVSTEGLVNKIEDATRNVGSVFRVATYADMLASPEGFYKVINDENTGGTNVVYYWNGSVATPIGNDVTAIEKVANDIYDQFSLADRLGTFNAATGAYVISETGVTGTLVATPAAPFTTGKYFDCDTPGTNSLDGTSKLWGVGDKIISAVTKWDRIPFGVGDRTIASDKIIPKAITHPVTDFLVSGKNLFNPLAPDVTLGYYIAFGTGLPVVNAAYNSTGYLPVTAGLQYTVSYKNQIAWYNSSKGYISGDNTSPTLSNITITAPVGAAYMRCSVILASWATFQAEQSASATAYEAFRLYMDKSTSADIFAKKIDPTLVLAGVQMGYIKGRNLFNPNDADVSLGNYINVAFNGIVSVNASYNATGFIPVSAGLQYTMSYKNQIAWYKADKTFISGSLVADTAKTQTAPALAAYLRCSVILASWSTFQVEQAAVATSYEPYSWYLQNLSGVPVYAKNVSVDNNLLMPAPIIAPKIYFPRYRELSIYNENVHRYYDKEGKLCEIKLTTPPVAADLVLRGRSMKYTQSGAGLTSLAGTLKTYDADFVLKSTVNFAVQMVDETKTTAVKILNFGDSYTRNSVFVDRLMTSAGATNVSFIGVRLASSSAYAAVRNEGRGGWGMVTYVTPNTTIFNPFLQPQAPYKYYGNTSHWIASYATPTDLTNGYMDTSIRALFDNVTGLKISPSTNDVMYQNSASAYKRWDGSAWVTVTGLTWTFDVVKYRTLFSFASPDVVQILLGTNDFAENTPAEVETNYATFKTRYDTVIAAFKADNASVKIIVGVPVSSGKQGRDGTFQTERRKAAFWTLAKKLYADYGNREGESIYLGDYHSTVDRVYGFDPQQVLPFSTYTGVERDFYSSDTVHLSADGYKQMGDVYMGLIQALR